MSLLGKLKFGYDPHAFVLNLIQEWRPRGCETEKDYEISLYNFLHRKLEGETIEITKQYGQGRIKGDIVVGRKVLIELKADLDSTSKLQRLYGQLELYSQDWKSHVIVVLCGEHDRNLIAQLQRQIEKYTRKDLLFPVNPLQSAIYSVMEK